MQHQRRRFKPAEQLELGLSDEAKRLRKTTSWESQVAEMKAISEEAIARSRALLKAANPDTFLGRRHYGFIPPKE